MAPGIARDHHMNDVALSERTPLAQRAQWRWADPALPGCLLPGLALSALLALAAMQLGAIGWLASHGISALTAAIALGILVGNTLYPRVAATAGVGVAFSKQTLLRAGVVLYGLRLTLHDVAKVGAGGVVIDAIVVTSTFVLAVALGTRLFRLDRETSMLIGAGSAICGAAAVMATEPVVRAKAGQVTIAVSTVVIFGTVAMFLYPFLYSLIPHGLAVDGARAFGIYTGSTVHEVAQVFCGRRIRERCGGQYGSHHQDGTGDDASAVPDGSVSVARPRRLASIHGSSDTRTKRPLVCCGLPRGRDHQFHRPALVTAAKCGYATRYPIARDGHGRFGD